MYCSLHGRRYVTAAVATKRKICRRGSTRSHMETQPLSIRVGFIGLIDIQFKWSFSLLAASIRRPTSRHRKCGNTLHTCLAFCVGEACAFVGAFGRKFSQHCKWVRGAQGAFVCSRAQWHACSSKGLHCGHAGDEPQRRHVQSSVVEKSPSSDFRRFNGGIARFPSSSRQTYGDSSFRCECPAYISRGNLREQALSAWHIRRIDRYRCPLS